MSTELVVEDGWRQLVSGGSQLDERQQQQQSAIWELVETEATYIHMLKVITDVSKGDYSYYRICVLWPMRFHSCLSVGVFIFTGWNTRPWNMEMMSLYSYTFISFVYPHLGSHHHNSSTYPLACRRKPNISSFHHTFTLMFLSSLHIPSPDSLASLYLSYVYTFSHPSKIMFRIEVCTSVK